MDEVPSCLGDYGASGTRCENCPIKGACRTVVRKEALKPILERAIRISDLLEGERKNATTNPGFKNIR